MVRQKIAQYGCAILLLASLTACGGDDNLDPRTITRATELPATFSCPQGELRSRTGIDANQNGLLEPEEVSSDIISCQVNNGLGGDDGPFGDDRPV